MSLQTDFFRYLDHFGRTCTLAELHGDPAAPDAIGLRHDIDHDLDLALEVAHHEHQRGLRATFLLLHTHSYWSDPDLLLKCRQIEAYGHEVGLHNNVLTEWVQGECDDVASRLRDVIETLRGGGVTVVGVSGHGDRACYEHGFINAWIWRELRGARFGEHISVAPAADRPDRDPDEAQHLVSAEGVPIDDPDWQVPYPADHQLRRGGGETLPLWSVSLRELGLRYDACCAGFDRYWTDTGGAWTRSGDPLDADLSRSRHQVLMHPVWWRGPQRKYFVVSTARSGSKWLVNFVDNATSCRGFHELSLNIERCHDAFVEDKRTNDAYLDLLERPAFARRRLRDALNFLSKQPGDVLEANVYLEPLLPELQSIAPKARIIHLHRHGRDVVRSILSRGWYDTPEDRRHRVPPIEDWDRMTQFERACWYYRHTNESIMPAATVRLEFERMVRDQDYLVRQLSALGIVVHPLLAEREFPKRINADREPSFPPAEQWSAECRATFQKICGPMLAALGYPEPWPEAEANRAASRRLHGRGQTTELLRVDFQSDPVTETSTYRVNVERTAEGLAISTSKAGAASAHLLLGRGRWAKVMPSNGFRCRSECYYRGRLEYAMKGRRPIRVFVLFFDQDGKQIRTYQAARLRPESDATTFAFSTALSSSHFALALHLGDRSPNEQLLLKRLRLQAASMHPDYPSAGSITAAARTT